MKINSVMAYTENVRFYFLPNGNDWKISLYVYQFKEISNLYYLYT